jgi:hypothetical protein
LVDSRNRLSGRQVLELVGLVADNVGVGKAARVMGLNSKTVGLFMSRLGSACIRSVERPRAWGRLQVDETFVGKRKHSRGKKSRARGWWFIACTEILASGASETSWTLVKRRTKEVCTDVVRRRSWRTTATSTPG